MKKIALLILATGVLVPCSLSAQKKDKNKKKNTKTEQTSQPITLTTENDSISYAFGVTLTEGLSQYLTQLEVLTDTAAINKDYQQKIQAETDLAKKEALQKELIAKLDEANNSNTINKARFLEGVSTGLTSSNDKAYENGIKIAGQMKDITARFSSEAMKDGSSIDMDKFVAGFLSAFKGEQTLLEKPTEFIDGIIKKSQEEKRKIQEAALKEQHAKTIAEGEKFMTENSTKPGVVTLPSGLQYKILKKGEGAIPKDGEKVTVHYHGTLLNGTVFDSSVDRGEPIDFNVGQLIKGWNEALMLMPEGSKWVLYIPYDLAYGTRDQGPIKPFSNLIFEVELIKVGD